MATTTALLLQVFVLVSIFLSTSITTAAGGGAFATTPLQEPSSPPPPLFQEPFHASTSQPLIHEHAYPSSLIGPILANLGFHGFSAAAPSIFNTTTWSGPTTIFAPSDSSLLSCRSCSVPLLLHEHTVPGLFPLHYLRTLAFGSKIETLSPGRCITITLSNSSEVYVGGVKITRPDLYNDGLVTVHGLQGFMSHLSPYSCEVERMTSLSFPHTPPASPFLMRMMLKDTMLRLTISGYGVVALALRVKYPDLLNLHSMTVFALDDVAIFSGAGFDYVTHFRFHIVPNRLLMATDLESYLTGTLLPTMEQEQKLVVTTDGRTGGPNAPIGINYVRIKSPDLMYNLKIVVHGIYMPFPHIHQTVEGDLSQVAQSGWKAEGKSNIPEIVAPTPVIESMIEMDDPHGL
ncbi:hypothetical protein CsSME_00042837 [Camellia sinensis var. sinensis]